MNALPLRRPRGFTLIELLMTVAISAIVLASLFGVVQSQQTAYFQGHLQRAAQGSARAALTYLEQRVAIAGYGLDASLAFDFRYYGSNAESPLEPMPCPALAAGCPRDSIAGNDELVFYARNPRYWVPDDRSGVVQPSGYAWRVLGVDDGAVTITARPGDVFEKGRVVQLVCKGAESWAYVTVGTRAAPIDPTNPSTLRIPLFSSVASNPFRRQGYAKDVACFTGGAARAFLIDRFRFHVRPVQAPGGTMPYLVLDTGLDVNLDGAFDEADETIVAEGIESFQVGYVMTSSTLTPRGTTPGTAIAFAQGTPTSAATTGTAGMTTLTFPGVAASLDQGEYEPTSWYTYSVGPSPAIAAERLTDHQGNIRAVRIAIVARGPDPESASRRSDFILPILNQTAMPPWAQETVAHSRARVETAVPVRNMVARGMNDF